MQVHHRWAVAGRHDMDAGAPTGAGRTVPARRQRRSIRRYTSSIAAVCRGAAAGVADGAHAPTIRPAARVALVLFPNRRWETGAVGSREFPGYCSFTKAIEHLGDRWSLLIVRQLGVFGPLGFNELSRSPAGPDLPFGARRAAQAAGDAGPGLARRVHRLPPDHGRRRADAGALLPARLGRDVASRRPRHGGARSRRRPRVAGPAGARGGTCPPSRWCWSSGRTSTPGATGWCCRTASRRTGA